MNVLGAKRTADYDRPDCFRKQKAAKDARALQNPLDQIALDVDLMLASDWPLPSKLCQISQYKTFLELYGKSERHDFLSALHLVEQKHEKDPSYYNLFTDIYFYLNRAQDIENIAFHTGATARQVFEQIMHDKYPNNICNLLIVRKAKIPEQAFALIKNAYSAIAWWNDITAQGKSKRKLSEELLLCAMKYLSDEKYTHVKDAPKVTYSDEESVKRLERRYAQVKEASLHPGFEVDDELLQESALTEKQCKKIARFIERIAREQQRSKQSCVLREDESGLARRVHLMDGYVVLISQPSRTACKVSGAAKQVLSVALLPRDMDQKTKYGIELGLTTQEWAANIEYIHCELPFIAVLKGLNVVQPMSVANYTEVNAKGKRRRNVSAITEYAGMSLSRLIPQESFRKIFDFKTFCIQVIATCSQMHQRGVLHGDLNHNNIVYLEGLAKFIDFGHASWIRPNDLMRINEIFSKKIYAAWYYTPLELMEGQNRPSSPSLVSLFYKKIESWVLGCLLLQLEYRLKNEELQWILKLEGLRDQINDPSFRIPKEYIEILKREHEVKIKQSLAELEKIPPPDRSEREHLFFVIYKLLGLEQKDRWTAEEAEKYLHDHHLI